MSVKPKPSEKKDNTETSPYKQYSHFEFPLWAFDVRDLSPVELQVLIYFYQWAKYPGDGTFDRVVVRGRKAMCTDLNMSESTVGSAIYRLLKKGSPPYLVRESAKSAGGHDNDRTVYRLPYRPVRPGLLGRMSTRGKRYVDQRDEYLREVVEHREHIPDLYIPETMRLHPQFQWNFWPTLKALKMWSDASTKVGNVQLLQRAVLALDVRLQDRTPIKSPVGMLAYLASAIAGRETKMPPDVKGAIAIAKKATVGIPNLHRLLILNEKPAEPVPDEQYDDMDEVIGTVEPDEEPTPDDYFGQWS